MQLFVFEQLTISNVFNLYRRLDVNAFGIWSNSSFKIFVNKTTDVRELKSELKKKYRRFFDNYPLDIETHRASYSKTRRSYFCR